MRDVSSSKFHGSTIYEDCQITQIWKSSHVSKFKESVLVIIQGSSWHEWLSDWRTRWPKISLVNSFSNWIHALKYLIIAMLFGFVFLPMFITLSLILILLLKKLNPFYKFEFFIGWYNFSKFRPDITITDRLVVEILNVHNTVIAITTSNGHIWMRISCNCYKWVSFE